MPVADSNVLWWERSHYWPVQECVAMAEAGPDFTSAVQDFWRARRRANVREVLSFFRRDSDELLSYEEVRRRMRAIESSESSLEDVPLDKIVGSVGRYQDFTRGFLPKQDSDKDRWAGVRQAMTGMAGVPPVEMYRVGDAYFVKDGNHRVSVARQLGSKYIQAYVVPVHTKVPLDSHDDLEELILKSEYARFLIDTRLDELRPDADLALTEPGQYDKLLEHISVHRYFMGIDLDRPVTYDEAVVHWYDEVYLPIKESIRENGLLKGFPGRTEADLYLWLAEHRSVLERELGWSLPTEAVVHGLAAEGGGRDSLDPARRERALRAALGDEAAEERICNDILVALPSAERARSALEQALIVARRENSRLYGLHVLEGNGDEEAIGSVRQEFDERCKEAGVAAQFAVVSGAPQEHLLSRAPWSDLVVTPLPSDSGGQARLTSGFRSFLRRCPRPVLTVRSQPSPLSKALLAYDGGPRAEAALFIAAYAATRWNMQLTVLTVGEQVNGAVPALDRARDYLSDHSIEATYLTGAGRIGPTIVETARNYGCDVILMGSHRYSPWWESMVGGVLEETLRSYPGTVLVA